MPRETGGTGEREELRARLREKLRSKRSTRGGGSVSVSSHTSALARAEETAMSLVGDDAGALEMMMGLIKNPKCIKDVVESVEYDDDEAPPPAPS